MEKNNEMRKEMEKNNELNRLYDLMEEIKKYSPEEEDEDLPESLPCGGVFKGDFGSATKAQVKAANREWRRRQSTGRFADDGSRWN